MAYNRRRNRRSSYTRTARRGYYATRRRGPTRRRRSQSASARVVRIVIEQPSVASVGRVPIGMQPAPAPKKAQF